MKTAAVLVLFVVAMAFGYAALDYFSITRLGWHHYAWFGTFRFYMAAVAGWISPLSFGLAENLFYVFVDWFGKPDDWQAGWYSGQWFNPDGTWQFIWGGDRYSMFKWYVDYGMKAIVWLAAIIGIIQARR